MLKESKFTISKFIKIIEKNKEEFKNIFTVMEFKGFYDVQKKYLKTLDKEQKIIVNSIRQSGCSTVTLFYLVYKCLCQSDDNVIICLMDIVNESSRYKLKTFKEIFKICSKLINVDLKIKTDNRDLFEANNVKIIMTSSNSINRLRGLSINYLFCDTFAYYNYLQSESLVQSFNIYRNCKIIICSNPRYAHYKITNSAAFKETPFFTLWKNAYKQKNGFKRLKITIKNFPDKIKYADLMLTKYYQSEFENTFINDVDVVDYSNYSL